MKPGQLLSMLLLTVATSCSEAPAPLGIQQSTRVRSVTLKSGESIFINSVVSEINGSVVKFSNGQTVDFSTVAAWK